MSLARINDEVRRLSPEDRAEVENMLRILRVTSSPEHRERVREAEIELKAGRGVGRDALQAVMVEGEKRSA